MASSPAGAHELHRPHHDGSPTHAAGEAPDLGDRVEVRVRVPAGSGVDGVRLRTRPEAEPQVVPLTAGGSDGRGGRWWVGEVEVTEPVTGYRFWCDGPGGGWLTAAGLVAHEPGDTTDFRLVADDPLPSWLDGGVLYQVFPDRFARSGRVEPDRPLVAWDTPVEHVWPASMEQWYGGDLFGVADRLDHLEALGVTGLYLTPIFPAPDNHRYNASDFDTIDPLLGGDAGLVALIDAAHARGLRVLGDLTANHTGDTHHWFRAARAAEDAVERGFYLFEEWPDTWRSWGGVGSLPRLDHRDEELRRRLLTGDDAIAARWLRAPFGLDGWRVDAGNTAGRGPGHDLTHRVARDLRDVLRRERPDGFLLAEHCHDASPDLDVPGGWHATMDYQGFTRPTWAWLRGRVDPDLLDQDLPVVRQDGPVARRTMDRARASTSWRTHRARVHLLGSHDTTRWRTVAGDRGRALAGFGLLLTQPGVPSILYGDEWGLTSAVPRDGSRVPMPWDGSAERDEELRDDVERLVRLRRDTPALRTGGFRWAAVGADHLTFLREHPDGDVLVHVARAAHGPLELPLVVDAALFGDPPAARGPGTVTLAADGPCVQVHQVAATG